MSAETPYILIFESDVLGSGHPALLSWVSWALGSQKSPAAPALVETVQLPLRRPSTDGHVPSALVLRRIPRHACSVAKRTRSPPPIVEDTSRKPLLHCSTVECAHDHRSHVSPRPPRTLRMPSISNNSFKDESFHDFAAQGCSKRTRPPRSTCCSSQTKDGIGEGASHATREPPSLLTHSSLQF